MPKLEFKGKKLLYNAGRESFLEWGDSSRTFVKEPKLKMLVAPFLLPFVPIEILSADMGGLIQSYSFAKSRSAAGGVANVTIAGDPEAIRQNTPASRFLKNLWANMGVDLRDLIKPQSYVQIWRDGYPVFNGYVTKCIRNVESNRVTYSVTMNELGCLYQENILSYSTEMYGYYQSILSDPCKFLSLQNKVAGQPLWFAINSYFAAFNMSSLSYGSGPLGYFRLSDGLPFSSRMIALPPPLGCISMSGIVSQQVSDMTMIQLSAGSSFWDFIKGICPEPLMELFTETGGRTICTSRILSAPGTSLLNVTAAGLPIPTANVGVSVMLPGFNYIVARTAPYDIPWIGITPWMPVLYASCLGILDLLMTGDFIIVTDRDIISKSLGQSQEQQFTSFRATHSNHSSTDISNNLSRPSFARGPLMPLFSGGLRTFGVRELEKQVNSTSLKFAGLIGETLQRVNQFVDVACLSTLMNSWFRNASKFNEGTITVRGMPYARPGMYMLYLPSINDKRNKSKAAESMRDLGCYYIDSIQDEYTIGRTDQTTLNVIRGVPIPFDMGSLMRLLLDWEILPPDPNITDLDVGKVATGV